MPTGASNIFGGGGAKVGQIVSGNFAQDEDYLPCDGGEYLKSAYPQLDYTDMSTFGSNAMTLRTSALPSSATWHAVAYANGLFVAIARSTSTSFATSPDGITWTERTVPSGAYYAIIYANNLWVAVGNGVCVTSTDGITWTARTMAGNMGTIAYGRGLFVAFGAGKFGGSYSGATTYYTSPDGITWTSRTCTSMGYADVVFDGFSFLASPYVSNTGGTYSYWYFSADGGLTFPGYAYNPTGTAVYGQSLVRFKNRLVYSGDGPIFVQDSNISGVGGSTAYPSIQGWSLVGLPTPGAWCLCQAGEWLFAMCQSFDHPLYATVDGLTWRAVASIPFTLDFTNTAQKMAYGNGRLVITLGTASQNLYTLDVDTTKFRVPNVPARTEADRFYIKAK